MDEGRVPLNLIVSIFRIDKLDIEPIVPGIVPKIKKAVVHRTKNMQFRIFIVQHHIISNT
jgi:hypothetical protein